MPVLSPSQAPNGCGQMFDPPVRGIKGIPLQFFVKPLVRQGGVFVDIPKGFELPTCMVDPCCEEVPPEPPEVG